MGEIPPYPPDGWTVTNGVPSIWWVLPNDGRLTIDGVDVAPVVRQILERSNTPESEIQGLLGQMGRQS